MNTVTSLAAACLALLLTVTLSGVAMGFSPAAMSTSHYPLASSRVSSGSIAPNAANVKVVHVLTAWHLDIGFADTIANIVNRYLDHFYTDSAQLARDLRADASPPSDARAKILVQPYILSLFFNCPDGFKLNCPNASAQSAVKQALIDGDLVMNAFPHNAEPETITPELFIAAVNMSRAIAASLSIPPPAALSQRDVPGLSRAAIPLLKSTGVTGISVGVNGASLPPAVPKAFVWSDESSKEEILAMYHPRGYGGFGVDDAVYLPDGQEAFVTYFLGDNQGPPNISEYKKTWAAIQKLFPNAQLKASSFDDFFAVMDKVRAQLPVVTNEIGDTWIHGIASDAFKTAAMRALMRAHGRTVSTPSSSSSPSSSSPSSSSPSSSSPPPQALSHPHVLPDGFAEFERLLLKCPEHTWGGDQKMFLHYGQGGDYFNWSNSQFRASSAEGEFDVLLATYEEQRAWCPMGAVAALTPHSALRVEIETELSLLHSLPPPSSSLQPLPPFTPITITNFTLTFDETGSVASMSNPCGQQLGQPGHVVLGLLYQTFAEEDYVNFFNEYAVRGPDGKIPPWFQFDFGKPNISLAHAQRKDYVPVTGQVFVDSAKERVLVQMAFEDAVVTNAGAPAEAWFEFFEGQNGDLRLQVYIVNKTATRLPESFFLSSRVIVPTGSDWFIEKLGAAVASQDVVLNGSRHTHGISPDGGVFLATSAQSQDFTVAIASLDAGVVCVGAPTPFPTPSLQPDATQGVHFSLSNNIWDTNYIMWYPYKSQDASSLFRFDIATGKC